MARKYDVKEAFVPLIQRNARRRYKARRHLLSNSKASARYSTPRDLSFRCSAERSMPMNSAVRDMLPPNRLI
jgi:hypothetical protein